MIENIDIKEFLRNHGFRHKQQTDRGNTWTNGLRDVDVRRDYSREPGQLRTLIDDVRKASVEKIRLKNEEAKKLAQAVHDVRLAPPQTAEEHREAQLAAGSILARSELHAPTEQKETEMKTRAKKKTFKKLAGDEAKYVFGRLKYFWQRKEDVGRVAIILNDEGVKTASDGRITSSWVNQRFHNWDSRPKTSNRYQPISVGRKLPGSTPPPTSRTVPAPTTPVAVLAAAMSPTVAPPPVAPTPNRLPTFVLAILKEPQLTSKQKVKMILAWAEEEA